MTHVAIIDYGSGNLRSAAKAFERVTRDKENITVTADPALLAQASHIVLPGVGAFGDCIAGLKKLPGMLNAMEKEVVGRQKPFLGICVGMQMLFEKGFEHGEHEGLGWLPGEVIKICCQQPATGHRQLKIPHMGWNDLTITSPAHPLLSGISAGDHAYFVHSFHAVCDPFHLLATVNYGDPLTAIVAKGNIMGTQFHPEKSQKTGLRLLENFLKITGPE